MKKIVVIMSLIFTLIPTVLWAQTPDYKVVFDLTSKDTLDHKAVIRWLNEISQANPNAQLEVVLYGQSLGMVTKGSSVAEAVTKLAQNKNIAFKVCSIAMKNQHVDKTQLLPGVQTVPDGIYEIISKQKEGWGYIKAIR
ncbi:MAG TPA: DsrE family protein [Daejeonella sp.]|nr:DsrE family protein [Daejeonella sp.]